MQQLLSCGDLARSSLGLRGRLSFGTRDYAQILFMSCVCCEKRLSLAIAVRGYAAWVTEERRGLIGACISSLCT